VSPPRRYDYLDNLRALAMLSGVLFHAALAYSPLAHAFLPTADRQSSTGVDVVIWFLHLFRMPLFFVVAGFFTAMLVARRGLGGMLRNRARRIALPFLLFCPLVFLALKHSTLQAALSVEHPSPVLAMIRDLLQGPGLPDLPPGTGHLWFLYYLLFFYVLVWVARSLELDRLGAFLRGLGPAWWLGLLPLLMAPALASVGAPAPAPESLLPQFWAFGFFGPFFVAGYFLHGQEGLLDRLRPFAPWLFLASVLAYAAACLLWQAQPPDVQAPFASLPVAWLEACIGVWMTAACLVAGRALLDRRNAVLRYLADTSYWVYLVHLPVLFALQYGLLDIELPWPAKFAIAVAATFAVCLSGYHLLARSRVFTAMFGRRAVVPMVVPAG